jgi:hypothetical protein
MGMTEYDPLTPAEEEWLLRRWDSTLNRIKENWRRLQKPCDRDALLRVACTLERGRTASLTRGEDPKLPIDVDEEKPTPE